MEKIGFWMMGAGLLLIVISWVASEKTIDWVEKKCTTPWYVQICTPIAGVLLLFAGWPLWCLGNRGRYPGYPLDLLIEWFR